MSDRDYFAGCVWLAFVVALWVIDLLYRSRVRVVRGRRGPGGPGTFIGKELDGLGLEMEGEQPGGRSELPLPPGRFVARERGALRDECPDVAARETEPGRGAPRSVVAIVMLGMLLSGCGPAVKVYGPVIDPCSVPLKPPPITVASMGHGR